MENNIIDNRVQMSRMLDDAVSIKAAADAIVRELDYRTEKPTASVDYIREKLETIQRCLYFLIDQVEHEELCVLLGIGEEE